MRTSEKTASPTTAMWKYSTIHQSICKVLEEETLWGQTVCRIWLPNQEAVVRVPQTALREPEAELTPETEALRTAYVAAAAKVAELLEGSGADGHTLLAPMESHVIPLPHQLNALERALSGDRVRYLLADEVGLGKTIEAGLIMRELKLRGLARKILVVAPKSLAVQWVAEMKTHFHEEFKLVTGEEINLMQRQSESGVSTGSAWSRCDQVIVSLDTVKPMTKRRGWSTERTAAYNRSRFEDLVTAGWDLVVVDEAHRLGGSTEHVARYKLGKGLAEAAPYVLLLSATPHQGKTDAFHRLMALLDETAFPDTESVTRQRVAPYLIRTEKRHAIDAAGQPLFQPRHTQMAPVEWEKRHQTQRLLYQAVTDYVREGYNLAMMEEQRHIGFLMILMQRLVVSSTRAIRTTLERRLATLQDAGQPDGADSAERTAETDPAEIYDMDGQELLDELMDARPAALRDEEAHVEALLQAARRCEQEGPDAKAEALTGWIYKLQAEENEADLKILIFTEFVPTQQMLKEYLEERGISAETLNGSMSMEERQHVQTAFRNSSRVLISTDAGGEGLNLQFAHVVINYDLPWNPMRLEQRIGRVDRIGQQKTVRAINFVFQDSVEFRVRETLEQKLAVIFEEFGIDKTGDVLDSAQAGELFEEAFTASILNPDDAEAAVEQTATRLREEINRAREESTIYGVSDQPDAHLAQQLHALPLPYWVERMTTGYLNTHGGKAERTRNRWRLTWPDGTQQQAVFLPPEADCPEGVELLNLENSRVRGLTMNLPQITAEQPMPCVCLPGLSAGITGYWGLFEIRLQAGLNCKSRLLRVPLLRRAYVSVFFNDDGQMFMPTARHIRESLLTETVQIHSWLSRDDSVRAHERLTAAAKEAGQERYAALLQAHLEAVEREEERGEVCFSARRKAIEHIGLPEVRRFRLNRCELEEEAWRQDLQTARQIVPEIRPLLVLRLAMPSGS